MEHIDDYELFDKDFDAFLAKGMAELEADDASRSGLSSEVLRGGRIGVHGNSIRAFPPQYQRANQNHEKQR